MTPDLIIIGGGMVGCAIADRATREGLTVSLFTAGGIGEGATAAGMGHLVVLDDDPAEAALSALSMREWDTWQDVPGAEFSRCGTLWIAANEADCAALTHKRSRLSACGIASEEITGSELATVEPGLRSGLAGALRVPNDAVIYAPRVCRLLMQRAVSRGAVVREQALVSSVDEGVIALQNGEIHRAAHIVVAAGLASQRLLPSLKFIPRKGHLVITDRGAPLVRNQIVEVAYMSSAAPSDAASSEATIAFNVQPRPTGQLLVGSCRQQGDASLAIDASVVSRMVSHAISYLPSLARQTALRTWTGVRPATPDGNPYIGRSPRHERVWVAAGHEGIGLTQCFGTAQILLEAMLQRESAIDLAPYSPSRLVESRLAA